MTKLNWGLYIGQKVKCGRATDVLEGLTITSKKEIILHCKQGQYSTRLIDCKPVLRDLQDMTDEETIDYQMALGCMEAPAKFEIIDDCIICFFSEWEQYYVYNPKGIDWFTSKGFAIRGELKNGLAIEAKDDLHKSK